jgi:hypothetical protein
MSFLMMTIVAIMSLIFVVTMFDDDFVFIEKWLTYFGELLFLPIRCSKCNHKKDE